MNRYPWHEAPKWATCAATDGNGRRYWYEQQPYGCVGGWLSVGGRFEEIEDRDNNWFDTLEQRPPQMDTDWPDAVERVPPLEMSA